LVLFKQDISREGITEPSQAGVDEVNRAIALDSYQYVYAHPDDEFAESFIPMSHRALLQVNGRDIHWQRTR
jgi:hypothetical protein